MIPLRAHDEEIGALRLTRERPFDRDDVVRATVLADFAAREHENSQLLDDARVREAERSRLSDQLMTAEQDERRRLANELHDGAVQSLSGVALMLDAGLELDRGRSRPGGAGDHRPRARAPSLDDRPVAQPLLQPRARRATRSGIRSCGARADGSDRARARVSVEVDVEAAEQLADKTQAAMYQIIREALDQAVRRGPPQTLSVKMRQTADGGLETAIADDAPGERRRRSLEELEERARTLNGVLTVDQGEDAGTTDPRRAPSLRDVPLGQGLTPAVRARPSRMRGRWPMNGKHLLFVSKTSGYELREADGDAPAARGARRSGRRRGAGDQGRALAAAERSSALRLPPSRLARRGGRLVNVPVPGTGTKRMAKRHATQRSRTPRRVPEGVPVPGTGTPA